MDRQTEFSLLDCVCIPCSMVKSGFHKKVTGFVTKTVLTSLVIGNVDAYIKQQKFTISFDL